MLSSRGRDRLYIPSGQVYRVSFIDFVAISRLNAAADAMVSYGCCRDTQQRADKL